jgi:hypothetical protein
MAHNATIDQTAHPAPHRERVRLLELILVTFAPPLAWSAHLVVNYAFSSRACYPDRTPQNSPSFDELWLLLIVVDVAALAISAAAAALAYRNWQASAQEAAEHGSPMVETGEGRTRFLASWGLMIGAGFFVAVAFDFVGLWIIPICG